MANYIIKCICSLNNFTMFSFELIKIKINKKEKHGSKNYLKGIIFNYKHKDKIHHTEK